MSSSKRLLLVLLLGAGALLTPSHQGVHGQPAPAAPNEPPKGAKGDGDVLTAREVRAILNKPTTKLKEGLPLNTPLAEAISRIGKLHGLEMRIDYVSFNTYAGENADEVNKKTVTLLPATWSSLSTCLRHVLGQVDAEYTIQGNHVVVMYWKDVFDSSSQRHDRSVDVVTERQPLQEVLEGLADSTGLNIVVDASVADRTKLPITAKLQHVSAYTVLHLLADMANLRATKVDNVIYLTTPEKAKAFQKDEARRLLLRQESSILPDLEWRDRLLEDVLAELADLSGESILLDPSIPQKGRVRITLSVQLVDLRTALQLLADSAGLKPAHLGSVYYLTTKEKAEELEKEFRPKP